jgi:peptidoglycan biosynthesis protein MviN/MurJ (putative lipid II flippase)
MLVVTPGILVNSPRFIPAAFTPVTLNLCVAALGIAGWIAGGQPPRRNR